MEEIKIMIVEDDESLAWQLKNFLTKWGYYAISATHFDDVLCDLRQIDPKLILMDINLPCYDGFYWCHQIREISKVPIIFISSKNDDRDKIMAISQGGDDYVEKPFQLSYLKAKIEALLRRTYQYKMDQKVCLAEGIYYQSAEAQIYFKQEKMTLTKSENEIIKVLIEHRGEIVSRSRLMDELWSTDEFISDNALTVLISRLRAKLKDYCQNEFIQTKKGQGYYIV